MQQLDQTRDQLRAASGQEQAQASLEAVWQARLFSLLEAQPDSEAHLLALVEQARAQLPGAAAADHSVAAGRDVNIEAPGGVAAAVIHGNVAPPKPYGAGPGRGTAGSGQALAFGLRPVAASGGVAVGELHYDGRWWRAGRCGWRPGRCS